MTRVFSIFTALALILFSSLSLAGNEGGHGGDLYSMEFVTLGKILLTGLTKTESVNSQLFAKSKFSLGSFRIAIANTRVVSAEGSEVQLRGHEVDGINNSDLKNILLNRTRWREDDLLERLKLTLHEYFGILAVEQDSYDVSIEFEPLLKEIARKMTETGATDGLMANLYYGRALLIPGLTQSLTCDSNSAEFAQYVAFSRSQAESKCLLSGKKTCQLISQTAVPVISTQTMGLRYCEISTVIR
jgi:hypothetical protein